MKKRSKGIVLGMAVLASAMVFAGCGKSEEKETQDVTEEKKEDSEEAVVQQDGESVVIEEEEEPKNYTMNVYDEAGNLVETEVWKDDECVSGKWMTVREDEITDYYAMEKEYNEYGDLIKETYYDKEGNLIVSDLSYSYDREYDGAGNLLKTTVCDLDGNCVRIQYEENGESVTECYDEEGQLESISRNAKNEDGERIKEEVYNSDGSVYVLREEEYDEDGRIIKYVYSSEEKTSNTVYTYNEDGTGVSETTITDADGNQWKSSVGEYDENGECIKDIDYNQDGTISYSKESQYDADGNEIKRIEIDEDSEENWEFKYDQHGNCVARVCNGILLVEEKYDDNNNILLRATYEDDGEVQGNIGYKAEYEYDQKQQLVKSTKIEYDEDVNEKVQEKIVNEYEHDEEGNVSKKITTEYDEDEVLVSKITTLREYEYDSEGRIVKILETVCDENEGTEIKLTYEYIYNE